MKRLIFLFGGCILFLSCENVKRKEIKSMPEPEYVIQEKPIDIVTPEGMVWIPGGIFLQGAVANDKMAMSHEKPAHRVFVNGFYMDITEVTNANFQKFVTATEYVTVAERTLDWEEIKKQVPPGTPKPPDSILQPGSILFEKPKIKIDKLHDYSQWWFWKVGANWRQPNGPGSSIEGKDKYPVVHIAYEDAVAYCKWAGRRLPTEAEWEIAANGGLTDAKYFWGNDDSKLPEMANTWNGDFPNKNSKEDGFEGTSPVSTFPPNNYGLFDMAGNVWEFTSDWYKADYYTVSLSKGILNNPSGPDMPANSSIPEKVIKGGSFLCNASYCASYRVSARMPNSLDSSQEHLGFRTVATAAMVRN